MEVVWTSDIHFGLKTDGIDRNEEIYKVVLDVVKYAYKLSKEKETVFILGGDIFNTNHPSEEQVNYFLKICAYLHKSKIKTYVLNGNHDAIFDKERKTCLSFLRNLKVMSEYITLIDDISSLTVKETDLGPIVFSFLPHVTKANYDETKFKSTQDYIDRKCKAILKKIGRGTQHYVFSHLNVKGAHGGSEENLLRKSEVFLPECFLDKNYLDDRPKIIQGHIHSPQVIDNINIIGSPIFCSFGENTEIEKQFLHISIPETFGSKEEWQLLPTNCTIYKQADLDLTEVDWKSYKFFELPEVKSILDFKDDREYHLKFNITVNAETCFVDWSKVKEELEASGKIKVKPIVPKYIRPRTVRMVEQKIGLPPIEAMKVFLKKNKPKRAKEKYSLFKKYLGNH